MTDLEDGELIIEYCFNGWIFQKAINEQLISRWRLICIALRARSRQARSCDGYMQGSRQNRAYVLDPRVHGISDRASLTSVCGAKPSLSDAEAAGLLAFLFLVVRDVPK